MIDIGTLYITDCERIAKEHLDNVVIQEFRIENDNNDTTMVIEKLDKMMSAIQKDTEHVIIHFKGDIVHAFTACTRLIVTRLFKHATVIVDKDTRYIKRLMHVHYRHVLRLRGCEEVISD